MSQRRQVGFIKTFSSKNILFQEEPSQFSYFKLKGTKGDEQFSPYKFQGSQSKDKIKALASNKLQGKPPLPERKTLKDKISSYLHGKAQAQQYYSKIKQRIASYQEKQSSSKQKLQQNIGNIRNKIERLDQVLKDLKSNKEPSVQTLERLPSHKISDEGDYKNNSSSGSSSSSQEVVVTAIPSPKIAKQSSRLSSKRKISAQKQQSSFKQTESKGVKFMEEDKSHQQNSQQQSMSSKSKQKNVNNENGITFNSRIKNQPPLYIKSYSSSSQSESQETQQIQEKAQVRNGAARPNEDKHQFFKNKGGVCFEVDVKQFTAPTADDRKQREKPTRPQKKEKVDKKAELLRRRQNAKVYDKKARKALFSPQY